MTGFVIFNKTDAKINVFLHFDLSAGKAMTMKLNLMDNIRICRKKNGLVFYGMKKQCYHLSSI